jgi:geranylgeranyl diphosphate synthase type II
MEFLKPYLEVYNNYQTNHKFTNTPATLYDPLNYLLELGGKRIRPCLVLLALDLYKDNLDVGLPVAYAVELFHNFTLMHDDIMDNAELRRGKETVHQYYDEDTAILSGDLMLIQAYKYLEETQDCHYKKLMQVFNKMAIEVCEGQRMDMDFELTSNVSILDYLEMIKLKTSVLLAASFEMGAIIGDAPEEDFHHIYEYGKNIGIAFQIQDDILDTYGDKKVGKKIGGDIIQNKKTYLYLKALELASDKEREELLAFYSPADMDPDYKIKKVTRLFDTLVVKEYAIQVMEAYKDLAISHLNQLSIAEENKKGLKQLADFLVKRNH